MDDNQKQIFAQRLSELRHERKLTQKDLSNQLHIQRVSIAKYETSERKPSLIDLLQFANFFDVPTDYLLGLSDVKSYDTDLNSICQYTGLDEKAVAALRQFNTKEHKDLMGIVNRLISEGVLTDMARILSEKEQVKYLKYDFMEFMVNLANKFVRR